jgi:phosphoglycolate phosphatase
MIPPQPPLLIFDLDGTLIDSAEDIFEAFNLVMDLHRLPRIDHKVIYDHFGEGLTRLLYGCFPNMSQSELLSVENDFLKAYDRVMFDKTQPYPGVMNFLQAWNGDLAVVSNKNERQVHRCLEGLGMKRFDWKAILGGDSLATKKPSPEPILEAIKRAQRSPEEVVMIGDSIVDIEAAKSAGIIVIAVAYGYTTYEHLLHAGPDEVILRFSDLPKTLEKLL